MKAGKPRKQARGRLSAAAGLAGLLATLAVVVPASGGAAAAPGLNARGLDAFTKVRGEPAPTHAGNARVIKTEASRDFRLDEPRIADVLDEAPADDPPSAATDPAPIALPAPDGSTQRFALTSVEVMAPELAAEHPEIQTYAGQGIDDPASTVRITQSSLGFQASVRGGEIGAWYIDPVYHRDQSLYSSYFGRDLVNRHGPLREAEGALPASTRHAAARQTDSASRASVGSTLRTYRLALISDPGYATYFGAAGVTAAKVALINRVDQVYEDELAIRMVLIAANDDLNLNTYADAIAPNGPCGADPCYTRAEATSCSGSTLDQTRTVAGRIVGAENFDIGHITLGQDGGGIASLGVVGRSAKAQGCTGIPEPEGDFYAVDYVSHEMGHQFAGDHTFNGNQVNCGGGNRNGGTSVEPGSGSSIMAYAGICGQDNLQPHSDPYFSQRSFAEVTSFVASSKAAVSEVQVASLRHFGGGNEIQVGTFGPGFLPATTSAFRIQIGANTTALIGGPSGSAFTNTGIANAVNAILGPGAVTVSGASSTSGTFKATFAGGADVTNMQITGLTDCSGCFGSIEEFRHGGASDSFDLSYNGGPTVTITRDANYNVAGLNLALVQVLPLGTTATATGIGGAASVDEGGFEVNFAGAGSPSKLTVDNFTPGASGFVNRIDAGGPARNMGAQSATGNHAPTVSAPAAYTIPYRTPFTLTGSGTDQDSDPLTYMWEQNDNGSTATKLVSPNKLSGPLFRQFGTRLDESIYDEHAYDSPGENHTTTDPSRTFPDLAQILANNTNAETGDCPGAPAPDPLASGNGTNVPNKLADCYSEFLPKPGYTKPMHFRLTARDSNVGGGGVASDDTTVSLAPSTGPFLLTSPNAAISWQPGTNQAVTWDVADTNGNPINAAKVKISLSTDGGLTYPTVLAASTANDGSARVTVPNVSTTSARIKVEAVGNVFFDLSNADFRIAAGPAPVTNNAPGGKAKVRYGAKAKVKVSATDQNSHGSDLSAKADGLPKGFTVKRTNSSGGSALPGTATFSVATSSVRAKPGKYPVTVTVKDGSEVTGATLFKVIVRKAKTKTKVSVSPSKPKKGKRATFKAKVNNSSVKPRGTVKFKLSGKTLGTAKVKGGVAKLRAKPKVRRGRKRLKSAFKDSKDRFSSSTSKRTIRVH